MRGRQTRVRRAEIESDRELRDMLARDRQKLWSKMARWGARHESYFWWADKVRTITKILNGTDWELTDRRPAQGASGGLYEQKRHDDVAIRTRNAT